MSRIDGNVTDFIPRTLLGVFQGASCECWMCQASVATRAAFCHECGTVQTVRPMTHFERLGLDCRFDLDLAALDARHAAQLRIFEHRRQAGKGPRQTQLAADHIAALDAAHTVLREPVKRAEYLLTLLEDGGASTPAINLDDVTALRDDLARATAAPAIDCVATEAVRGVETCIRDLSKAFRRHTFTDVWGILARLGALETLSLEARARRTAL